MIIVCIPLAWLWMLPNQAIDFSKSLVAVVFFASNFLFWKENGYFEATAEEKPLLHTWSLAVEEQYYIFLPIFLFLTWRYGRNNVLSLIIVLAAISLAMSEWGWRNNPTANFYLAPTRAWELFAGSIAAFIVQKRGVKSNNALSLLGLGGIFFAILAYSQSTPFPSVYALVPVIGVVLVLVFADKETFVAKLLSKKFLVGTGLISYSAYLWHQPLFAFARIRSINSPSFLTFVGLSITTMCLAYFSWRYIERPFRNKTYFKTNKILLVSGILSIFVLSIGAIGYFTNGMQKFRFNEEQLMVLNTQISSPHRQDCHYPLEEKSLMRNACHYFSGDEKVAVFGNSHATELAYSLAIEIRPFHMAVVHHTMSGCKHNFGVANELDTVCQRWHDMVLNELIADNEIEAVVLSYRNEHYLGDEKYINSLVKMTDILLKAGKKVIFVLQAPLPGAHIDKYFSANADNLSNPIVGIDQSVWEKTYSESKNLLEKMSDKIIFIDPSDFFCEDRLCYVAKGGHAYYFDDNHMSVFGAKIISEAIVPFLI